MTFEAHRARLEHLARQLGQLLKSYAGDPGSATDFMGLINAFGEGLNGDRQMTAQLLLPIISRLEPDIAVAGYPDMAAPDIVQVTVGPDYLDVTKHHFYDPTRWRQPNIVVTFDEKERMQVKLNGSPLGTEHRILSEDRGEFVP